MNAFVDDAAHLRKVVLGRRDGTLERIAVAQIDERKRGKRDDQRNDQHQLDA